MTRVLRAHQRVRGHCSHCRAVRGLVAALLGEQGGGALDELVRLGEGEVQDVAHHRRGLHFRFHQASHPIVDLCVRHRGGQFRVPCGVLQNHGDPRLACYVVVPLAPPVRDPYLGQQFQQHVVLLVQYDLLVLLRFAVQHVGVRLVDDRPYQ